MKQRKASAVKQRIHFLHSTLIAAEQSAVRNNTPTVFVVVFRPGKKGRKTADSTSTWRYLPAEDDLIEHLSMGRVLR